MSKRKILIIHESHTLRDIIQRQINSELSEVNVTPADSPKHALELLESNPFDVVICANEMEAIDGAGVYHEMIRGYKNKQTPFIILTSSASEEKLHQFHSAGIKHVMKVPFNAKQLSLKIDEACNPRTFRTSERLHIPGMKINIIQGEEKIKGVGINLSCGGLLSDHLYKGSFSLFNGSTKLDITIPDDNTGHEIHAIGKIVRIVVASWKKSGEAEMLRIAWNFAEIDEANQALLEQILSKHLPGHTVNTL